MKKDCFLRKAVLCLLLAALAALATPASAKITKQSLQETETKVKAVIQRALPCTVSLASARTGATGSGVIVSSDGLILTAGHVTRATGDELMVFLPDGRRVKAKALGANYGRDASMAKIVEEGEFPFVDVGDSQSLELDQWCISLGHAAGFQRDRTAPIRLGRILGKNLIGFVSTDCTLIGGDSGGPLLDLDGRLIGIHSNIGTTLSENHHVPIAVFKKDWDRMLKGDRWGRMIGAQMPQDPNRPMLGVQPSGAVDGGMKVDVIPGAPAARAGLKDGDVIKSVGGKATPDNRALLRAISSHKAGQKVDVVVSRGEEELTIEVRLMRARDVHPPTPSDDAEPSSDEPTENTEPEADADSEASKPTEKNDEASEEDPDKLLGELVEQAQREGQRLELSPEQLEKLGGIGRFMERMRKISKNLKPQDLARLMGIRAGEDTFFSDVIAAYRPVVAPASRSVHRLMKGNRQVVLGTVVHSDGYLLTKASEVKGHEIKVDINGKRLPATLLREFPAYDLALMKVEAKLVPIAWDETAQDPALGSFVTAAGPDDIPLAVGLISVAERSLSAKDKPFLGVGLELTDDGLRVTEVMPDGAAAKAGLKKGDVITAMDGKHYDSVQQFVDDLQERKPGDKVKLEYLREKKEMEAQPELGDRSSMETQGPGLGMYPQGGRLSENRGGYPRALQTDLPIAPQECGSPVVGLDGRVLGINIANAGRIKSYAIPASVIRELLKDAITEQETSSVDRSTRALVICPTAVTASSPDSATDNDKFFNGNVRQQNPLYTIQGFLDYTLPPGLWAGAGIGYVLGGKSTLNGIHKDDPRDALIWGPVSATRSRALIITLRNASEGWLGSSCEERAASPQIVAFWGLADQRCASVPVDPSHPSQCQH